MDISSLTKDNDKKGINWSLISNVCIGSGLGIASGYCYHKYTKLSSVGFGMGYFATHLKGQATKYLDFNKDGKLDLDDVEALEDKIGMDFTLVGFCSFAGGFGLGYLGSMFF